MPQIDEPTTSAPKSAPAARKAKPPAPSKTPGGIYAFTIDTGSGKIVTVESVDPAGVRHSLSADEKTKLARTSAMPVKRLVEQAFEAGIEFILGEDTGTDGPESKEDGELSGALLQTLIEGSKAKDLVKGDTLDRSVIDTLIIHAAK